MVQDKSSEVYEIILKAAKISKSEIGTVLGVTHVAVLNALKRGLTIPYIDALAQLLIEKRQYARWREETDRLYLSFWAIPWDLREMLDETAFDFLRDSFVPAFGQKKWVPVGEAARLYGCKINNIYQLKHRGTIRAIKHKGHWLFNKEDILEKRQTKGLTREKAKALKLTFGGKIKKQRKRLGLTQQEVADRVGISQSGYSAIEKDMVTDYKVLLLWNIAQVLELDWATMILDLKQRRLINEDLRGGDCVDFCGNAGI